MEFSISEEHLEGVKKNEQKLLRGKKRIIL